MRLYSIIFLAVFPVISMAQQPQNDLWGSKKFRFGFSLQVAPSLWKQNNLNNELRENTLPVTRNISHSIAVGDIIQCQNFRFTLLLMALINGNSTSNNHLNQQFGGIELNSEYFIIKKEKMALSPMLGGGILYGTTRLRREIIPVSFPDALANGNTSTLFNRQGYLNFAMNLGFNYSPRYREHIYQLSLGYKYGFLNTQWSTNPRKEIPSQAPTDALRLLYVAIKMNLLVLK